MTHTKGDDLKIWFGDRYQESRFAKSWISVKGNIVN